MSDAVTKYLAPGADADSCNQKVRSYGEYQLAESSSADLLFQAEDCAAAAFCYRIPEQLVQNLSLLTNLKAMSEEQVGPKQHKELITCMQTLSS